MDLIGVSTYWVGRRFKPIWRLADDEYAEARERAFRLCNQIRRGMEVPEYNKKKFDEGWQYRTIFHDNYVQARIEFINLVFGWW
jgi:hypothetical protein